MTNTRDRNWKYGLAVALGWLTLQHIAPLCQAGLLASCRFTEDEDLWSYLGIIPTHGDTDGLG